MQRFSDTANSVCFLAPLVGKGRIALSVGPGVMLHAACMVSGGKRRLLKSFTSAGTTGFDDLDTVQVLHLPFTKLDRDRPVKPLRSFHCIA